MNLSPVDEANLRKAMMDIIFLTSLTIAGLMLKGMADDDEEESFAYNLATNQLMKLQRDMTFFVNPASFAETLRKSECGFM